MFNEFEKFSQLLVESTKFDLFYDVCVEKKISEALQMCRTAIWFLTNSNHTVRFTNRLISTRSGVFDEFEKF